MAFDDQRHLIVSNKGEKYLLLADFHVGFELEMQREAGVRLHGMSEILINEFIELIEKVNPSTVFILGDLEHSFRHGGSSKDGSAFSVGGYYHRKYKEKVLEPLGDLEPEIILIRGNHDISFDKILPQSVRVIGSRGYYLETTDRGYIGLLHGHSYPSFLSNEIILSHIHPTVLVPEDGLDVYHRMAVFLRGKISRNEYIKIVEGKFDIPEHDTDFSADISVTILPAFNKQLIGTAVNRSPRNIPSAFMSKLIALIDFDIILSDGRFLGKLSELSNNDVQPTKKKRGWAKNF